MARCADGKARLGSSDSRGEWWTVGGGGVRSEWARPSGERRRVKGGEERRFRALFGVRIEVVIVRKRPPQTRRVLWPAFVLNGVVVVVLWVRV